MSPSETAASTFEDHPARDGRFPEFIDWLLAAIIGLSGLIALVGATALLFAVDEDVMAEGVERETMTMTVFTRELTEAETLEVTEAVVSWTGIGMLVVGIGLVLFALWYLVRRRRAHRRARTGEPTDSYWAFAVMGGVATALLSFLPLSPAIGGAIAGYLERGEADRALSVGALAGFLPTVSLLVITAFVLAGMVVGMLAIEEAGMAVLMAATMLFAIVFIAVVAAGLGAIGGYLGGWFAEKQARE